MYEETSRTLDALAGAVEGATADPARSHDRYVIAALQEALAAAANGNFGVGAVIVDGRGQIVERGHNHVFHPHFRSDIHAEMDVLDRFEDANPSLDSVTDYTLYTSLEPCPMCLTRLITSAIPRVYYAAPDTESGMVSRLDQLTPVWVELAKGQEFAPADCSPDLATLALEIFLHTAETSTARLMSRRR